MRSPIGHDRTFRAGSGWLEAALVVLVVAVAAYLRLLDLATVPPGLHGDEAIVGLEGRRILANGWIGPYTPAALGQPTGPLYATALSLRLFGETAFAVRVGSAFAGTATVVALFVVLRRVVAPAPAIAGAALLAGMGWHLHFSRIGFPLAWWPLAVVLAVGAVLEAVRRDQPGFWAVAGAAVAAGVYVYNAHVLFLVVVVGFALVWLGGWVLLGVVGASGLFLALPNPVTLGVLAVAAVVLLGGRRLAEARRLSSLAAFGGGLALVLLPMARFAADARTGYFQHFRDHSVFDADEWTSLATGPDRVSFLLGRWLGFWDRLCCRTVIDGVDGTGVTPIVPVSFVALSVVGLVIGLRRRQTLAVLAAVLVATLPLGAVLTVEGAFRRTFALAVVLAALAGFAVVELARAAWRRGGMARLGALLSLLVIVAGTVFQGLRDEVAVFPASPQAAWVFARDMTEAARFMAALPADRHVLFLSERWSVDYETRRFLAPDVAAEDRSAEFGRFGLEVDPGGVFVLLGRYRDLVPELRARHPGGEVVTAGPSDDPFFVAYFVSAVEVSSPVRARLIRGQLARAGAGCYDGGGPATPIAIRSGLRRARTARRRSS